VRTTVADAASAVLLAAVLPDPRPGVAATAGELRDLVADEILGLEIQGWVEDGGPDGEQLYCLADILQARLAADAALASRLADAVLRDDSAVTALETLARLNAANGRTGAATWCREVAAAVRSARSDAPAGSRVLSWRPGRTRR
jgi:hypothetical protein